MAQNECIHNERKRTFLSDVTLRLLSRLVQESLFTPLENQGF